MGEKKRKVLHLLNTGGYSGAEFVAISIIENLNDSYDSIYGSPNGTIKEILEQKEISFYEMDNNCSRMKAVKNVIVQCKPDIVHCHDYTMGVLAAFCGVNCPIVNHIHNNAPWIKRITVKTIIYIFACLRIDRIISVSNEILDEAIFKSLIKKKTTVVGNPINVAEIRKKAEFYAAERVYDIAFLGRMSKAKNPLLFIEIIKTLVEDGMDLSVAMIGDGELRAQVESRIKEYELEQVISLYGFVENPYPVLKNSKVMCMPSLWEGYGLAAVEALSLGVPVVVAPVGGLKSIVTEECGFFCDSEEEYVVALSNLLNDNRLYKKMKEAASQRADEMDNMETYLRQIIEIYKELR